MEQPLIHDHFRLARPARPAGPADAKIAEDLRDTLLAHQETCVGMAANMIGQNVAIIVFFNMGVPIEMWNPVITGKSGPYETEETCLSVIGTHSATRYQSITVSWEDAEGKKRSGEFHGFTAQIIQHEIDHCHGVLI